MNKNQLAKPRQQLTLKRGVTRAELAEASEYRLCEYMGRMGLSYYAMQKELGWSTYKIAKALKNGVDAKGSKGIKVRDYRRGENKESQAVIAKLDQAAQRKLVADLNRVLLKGG